MKSVAMVVAFFIVSGFGTLISSSVAQQWGCIQSTTMPCPPKIDCTGKLCAPPLAEQIAWVCYEQIDVGANTYPYWADYPAGDTGTVQVSTVCSRRYNCSGCVPDPNNIFVATCSGGYAGQPVSTHTISAPTGNGDDDCYEYST